MSSQKKNRVVSLDGHELNAEVTPAASSDTVIVTVATAEHRETREVRLLAKSPFAVVLVGTRVLRWALSGSSEERELTSGSERRRATVMAAERKAAASSARKKRHGQVVAPMPGRIVSVAVQAGAAVNAGDVLLVIEAMKMQNEILAPAAGNVTRVAASAGDAVERGAVLIEIG